MAYSGGVGGGAKEDYGQVLDVEATELEQADENKGEMTGYGWRGVTTNLCVVATHLMTIPSAITI